MVEPDDEDGSIPQGEFVAITVRGGGSWDDDTWRPRSEPATGTLREVGSAAGAAGGGLDGYARDLGDEGSVTVFLPRLPEPR